MGSAPVRLTLYGLLAGALLSAMRAPLGLDWTQVAVVDGTTAAVFRAAALLAVALFLDPARPAFRGGVRPVWLLLAITGGFFVHGAFLALMLQPDTRLGIGILFVCGTFLLWLAAGKRGERTQTKDATGDFFPYLSKPERLGLLLGGCGAAVALETLAHTLRQFGVGLPGDDTIFGTVFLLSLTVGALCFGNPLDRVVRRRTFVNVGLVLTALATLQGLASLGGLDRDGLWRYFKFFPEVFRLGFSLIGGSTTDGILAASTFVLAGFAGGFALYAARHPARLASLLLGAAIGLMLRPLLLTELFVPMTLGEAVQSHWSWQMIAIATSIAGLGTLLGTWGERGTGRLLGAVLGAGAVLTAWMIPPITSWSFSPWFRADISPTWIRPTPEGILTVEALTDGYPFVTLDRVRVSPALTEVEVDEERLRYACALIDPSRVASGAARVLLIGQLTPDRDYVFRDLGLSRIDRTAPWYSSLASIERELFGPGSTPLGTPVAPGEARKRLRNGNYDLVIALPGHGPVLNPKSQAIVPWGSRAAPIFGALEVPEGTVGVAWVDAASPLAVSGLHGDVMLAMHAFQSLTIGAIYGDISQSDPERLPFLLDAGSKSWTAEGWLTPWSLLSQRSGLRSFELRERILERMSRGAEGPSRSKLAEGLKLHYAAQVVSSPFDTLAQSIELNEVELQAFFEAVSSAGRMDPFTRKLWEGLAWLLVEKRMPDMMITYVEALADAYTPWPALDRGLAIAHDELLQPAEGLRFLERALESEPGDLNLYRDCAEIALAIGEPLRAAEFMRGALKIQPGRFDLRRGLALALFESGDPEGQRMLDELLIEEPGDAILRNRLYGEPIEADPSESDVGDHTGHAHE